MNIQLEILRCEKIFDIKNRNLTLSKFWNLGLAKKLLSFKYIHKYIV